MKFLALFNKKEIAFIIYLLIINIVSFITFGIDKKKSKQDKWRTKESVLFILSILGGASGSLIGMIVFHHKISKKSFYIGIPIVFILNKIIELIIIAYLG